MGDYSKHCKCGQQKEIYLYGIQYIKTSRPCALNVTGGSDGLLAAKGPGLYRCAAKAERRPRGWAGSCRYRTHANSQGAAQQRALSAWAPGTLSSPDDRGEPRKPERLQTSPAALPQERGCRATQGHNGQPGIGQEPQGLSLDLVCDFRQLTDELKTQAFLSLHGPDGGIQTQRRDAQRLV